MAWDLGDFAPIFKPPTNRRPHCKCLENSLQFLFLIDLKWISALNQKLLGSGKLLPRPCAHWRGGTEHRTYTGSPCTRGSFLAASVLGLTIPRPAPFRKPSQRGENPQPSQPCEEVLVFVKVFRFHCNQTEGQCGVSTGF